MVTEGTPAKLQVGELVELPTGAGDVSCKVALGQSFSVNIRTVSPERIKLGVDWKRTRAATRSDESPTTATPCLEMRQAAFVVEADLNQPVACFGLAGSDDPKQSEDDTFYLLALSAADAE